MKESNYDNKRDKKSSTLTSHTNIFFWETEKYLKGKQNSTQNTGERNFEVTNTDSRPRKIVRLVHIPLDALFQQELQMNYDREKKSAVRRNRARSSQLCSPLSSTSN